MKILAIGALAAAAIASPVIAQSGPDSPTVTHANPSSCLGAERASRNSNGGDRAQGGFGQVQSQYVRDLNAQGTNYGAFLTDYLSQCQYAPGMDDDDGEL